MRRYPFGEVFCKIVSVFFILVLFLLSCFVKEFLLSLSFLLVLCRLEEGWWCKESDRRRRNASSCHLVVIPDIGDVFRHQSLLDLALKLGPMMLFCLFLVSEVI